MRKFPIVFLIVFISGCAYFGLGKGDLETLMELKRNQDDEERYAIEKTDHFEEVSKKISGGIVKAGDTKDEVVLKIGNPILRLTESHGETFVYRPMNESWFGGSKIYLYFNADNQVTYWECFHVDCGQS